MQKNFFLLLLFLSMSSCFLCVQIAKPVHAQADGSSYQSAPEKGQPTSCRSDRMEWNTLIIDSKTTPPSLFDTGSYRGKYVLRDRAMVDLEGTLIFTRIMSDSISFGSAAALTVIQIMRLLAASRSQRKPEATWRKKILIGALTILFLTLVGCVVPWLIDDTFSNRNCGITFC